MAKIDKKYHELLQYILDNGRLQDDPNRKGVKRLNIPRYNFEYDLKYGFPAITTKKLYWKGIVGELLFFLRGETNIKYLVDNGVNIWNKDAYNYYIKEARSSHTTLSFDNFIDYIKKGGAYVEDKLPYSNHEYILGDLGRVYGAMWRNFRGSSEVNDGPNFNSVDQISNLIKNLKEKPLSSSHIVTAWNPAELDNMALPPCHKGFQLMVYELTEQEKRNIFNSDPLKYGNTTSLMFQSDKNTWEYFNKVPQYGFDLVWEQRSVDTFLGLPFNIASYALLAHIIGKIVNMVPGNLYGDLRNVHIYDNHIDAVKKQLSRDVNKYDKCELEISEKANIHINTMVNLDIMVNNLEITDFNLLKYKSYPSIKAEMLSRDE